MDIVAELPLFRTGPLTALNWAERWHWAHGQLGWATPRPEMERVLKEALLAGGHVILSAPTGWGKTGVWKLAFLMTGLPVVVIHPLVSIGIDGGLEAALIDLAREVRVIDGSTANAGDVEMMKNLGTPASTVDIVFITMDQLVKINPALRSAMLSVARVGRGKESEVPRRLAMIVIDEFGACRIEGIQYRDKLLDFPALCAALSDARQDLPLVLTDATVDDLIRAWARDKMISGPSKVVQLSPQSFTSGSGLRLCIYLVADAAASARALLKADADFFSHQLIKSILN